MGVAKNRLKLVTLEVTHFVLLSCSSRPDSKAKIERIRCLAPTARSSPSVWLGAGRSPLTSTASRRYSYRSNRHGWDLLRSLPQIRLFFSSMSSSNLWTRSGLHSRTVMSHATRQELCGRVLCRCATRPLDRSKFGQLTGLMSSTIPLLLSSNLSSDLGTRQELCGQVLCRHAHACRCAQVLCCLSVMFSSYRARN